MNIPIETFNLIDSLSEKPRSGWVNRNIPLILCESVWEHSLNVERACKSLIIGNYKIENQDTFSQMGKYHDLLEAIMDDITPYDGISEDEKLKIEFETLEKVNKILGVEGKNITLLVEEYLKQQTNDSKTLLLLDKIDAGIKAFEYEKLGYKVSDFHPYVLSRIKDNKYLLDIYNILLKKEFNNIDYHFQYFTLLQLGGNYDKYKIIMNELNK